MTLLLSNLIKETDRPLTRPIQLMNGKPYFATVLSFSDGTGHPVSTWVVTDSKFQERYSEKELQGHKPFTQAPFLIDLKSRPRHGSTLSATAYLEHVVSGKPIESVLNVFNWTSEAIDRFVSFDGSFASQEDMSNLLACWVMSTYATDALETVGYPWPSGERGSGKSQCLKTLMELSFMGITLTAGSSFASIRDEAALGATIGFDDCENIFKMDQNKRDLLLAGNTKGAGFTHKVAGSRDGTWDSVYMDCFAPRAFTSIGLPDDVLGSRTITIPLTRSADVEKTRRKPTNSTDWVISSQLIRDAIWLNVATNLDEIQRSKAKVNSSSEIAGREFDIFQGPLSIAHWIERTQGMDGLLKRMLDTMSAYHSVKHKNLLPSLEECVLQALYEELQEKKTDWLKLTTKHIGHLTERALDMRDITDPSPTEIDVQKLETRYTLRPSRVREITIQWISSQLGDT